MEAEEQAAEEQAKKEAEEKEAEEQAKKEAEEKEAEEKAKKDAEEQEAEETAKKEAEEKAPPPQPLEREETAFSANSFGSAEEARAATVDEQHQFLDLLKASKKSGNYKPAEAREMVEKFPGIVNVQPSGRYSALHYCAEKNDVAMVKYLLQKGADRTLRNNKGKTPKEVASGDCIALFA